MKALKNFLNNVFRPSISVGTSEYNLHIREEIKFYKDVYRNSLVQEVPSTWQLAEDYLTKRIVEETGFTSAEYILSKVKGRKHINFYSIGAGAGGVEIETLAPLFKNRKIACHFTLSDINEDVLLKAQTIGKERGFDIDTEVMDANKLVLSENTYDIIYAHASLHHLIDLNRATKMINNGLKKRGYFVTNDICTRNGYLLWEDTVQIMNALWAVLPPKFKISRTAYSEPKFMEQFPNINLAVHSFECIRSQDVVPSLRKNLREVEFIPVYAFMRRFLDTQFGPNFDLTKELDRSIIDFIIQLDDYYVKSGILKPETFFGVYSKK